MKMNRLRSIVGVTVALAAADIWSPSRALADDPGVFPALPTSTNGPFQPGAWTLEVSNRNSAPSDWLGLDESQVFLRRLTHTQDGCNWTIKIGKGGQIYSIATPEVGEMIARQRISSGQWIDEVFQHTIPSSLHNKSTATSPIVDGDIHQAGYYTKSDFDPQVQVIPASVYSPVFGSVLEAFHGVENSYSLITWPQHAHLPRTYFENGMLMHQLTRDIGDGVVEISLLITKWGGEETQNIGLPWSAWRKQSLPAALISSPDGSFAREDQPFADGLGIRKLKDKDTGGWIAFAQSASADSYGIGIVFGKSLSVIEGATGYVRWGNYGTGLDGGTVGTVKRQITLLPGDSVFSRYFLVIGTVAKIQHYGNLLQSRVEVGRVRSDEKQAGLIRVCGDELKKLQRGCADPSTSLFYTYRDFLPDALPLFLLGQAGGSYRVSADPYEVSGDPTDGKTEYSDFLGWSLPNRSGQGGCFEYQKLSDVARGLELVVSDKAATSVVRSVARFKADGTDCDDANACTSEETCKAGVCGAPRTVVNCATANPCREEGRCDPATGLCSGPEKADGSPCPGGICQVGVCIARSDGGDATSPSPAGSDGNASSSSPAGYEGIGSSDSSGGCGCEVAGHGGNGFWATLLLLLFARRRLPSKQILS